MNNLETTLVFFAIVMLCVTTPAAICMAIILHDSKDNSRAAQRQHDQEYAPAGNVYVVLQTTNNYTTYEEHTHNDNRSITIDANAMPLIADTQRALQAKPARQFKVVGGY